MTDIETHFIPTRGSTVKQEAEKKFEFVTYLSHKKAPKVETASNIKPTSSKNDEIQSVDIKKVKQEIVKFGMSALDPVKKEEAKVQLAIRLGAKPPKNKYKNYKQLLLEKKNEKKEIQQQNLLNQLGKNKVGKSTAKGKSFDRKRKKIQGSILGSYGKVKK